MPYASRKVLSQGAQAMAYRQWFHLENIYGIYCIEGI